MCMDRRNSSGEESFRGSYPLSLPDTLGVLWSAKWLILLVSLGIGLVTAAATYAIPNYYRASAVVKPESPDQPKTGGGVFGILSTMGVSFGSSKVEDLEVLFKSRDLAFRVFEKHGVWALAYPDRFDSTSGLMRPGLLDRLIRGESAPRPPGRWDAYDAARKWLKVTSDRRTGTVLVSYDSGAPEASARIVSYFLEEAKNRLQEEALLRASQNKKFLLEQMQKTVDPMTRDRLYSLYGQEVEKEMLARNREQFGFILIDSPVAPKRKAGPMRALTSLLSCLAAGFIVAVIALLHKPVRIAGMNDSRSGSGD